MMRALTRAQRITDTTLGAAAQPFTTPAENMGLLAAMSCNHLGGPIGCPGRLTEPAGNNGDRAPGTGAGRRRSSRSTARSPRRGTRPGPHTIGTSATVARVGDQLYATAPGEAFPRSPPRSSARSPRPTASAACTSSTTPATSSATTGTSARASTRPSSSRRATSTGSTSVKRLAQDNVDAVRAAGTALGLAPTAQNAFAEINDPDAFAQPTIQFYPNRVETADPAVSLYGSAKKAQSSPARLHVDRLDGGHPERRPGQLGLRRRHDRDA